MPANTIAMGLLSGARRVDSPNRDARPAGFEPELVVVHGISLPPGSFGHGYFNIHGDSPIGGHIKADNCKSIAFVARGAKRISMSVQFFNAAGDAMFKIFVGRDENRELKPEQVQKFEALREQLRRRVMERIASQAGQKVEAEVKSWFTDKSVK